jgi:hypothetical protein
MQLTAGDAQDRPLLQRLLPDALLWVQHMKQFALMRNEGEGFAVAVVCVRHQMGQQLCKSRSQAAAASKPAFKLNAGSSIALLDPHATASPLV